MSDFAPTPLHGAAYAVAIDTVGGMHVIGDCSTTERYLELKAKLDELRAWAATQPKDVRAAYVYGIERVDADATARLAVHENSRKVGAALLTIPRPK